MTLTLTPPQQRFVDAIAAGKSQTEAYAAARFPRASSTKRSTIAGNAARLARAPAVAQALARATDRAIAASAITVETLVADLQESRRAAFACDPPQISATVAATVAIGKLLGLYVDKREVEVKIAKPGFNIKALELSEDEWTRQFAPALLAGGTVPDGR